MVKFCNIIYPLLDNEHYRTVAIYRPSVSAHDLLGPVNGARYIFINDCYIFIAL